MSEDLLLLMTAAIDGELTPAEAKRLKDALAVSAEARAVFAKLKADARRLRALPRLQPPAGLKKRIMARVAAVAPPAPKPQPRQDPYAQPAATTPSRRVPAWVPFAVAASVLVCVTAGSFFFFAGQRSPGKGRGPSEIESAKWLPAETAPRPSVPVPRERTVAPDRTPIDVAPEVPPHRPPVPPESLALAPEPRTVRPELMAFPPIPDIRFDLVRVRVPFLKALAELQREDARQELVEELALDPAFRIDLFARDPGRGVEAFQAAAKAASLTLHADAATLAALKKKQGNAVVIYTESLTAGELAELFGKLVVEDAKYSPRVFDVLHAVPASGRDADELKALFGGTDPGLFKRALGGDRNERGDRIDPSKPISAGTADQIVKTVTGAGKGTDKVEKHAVLLTWSPVAARTQPAASTELKQFLAKRGARPANAVPVVIVIRPANG